MVLAVAVMAHLQQAVQFPQPSTRNHRQELALAAASLVVQVRLLVRVLLVVVVAAPVVVRILPNFFCTFVFLKLRNTEHVHICISLQLVLR
jgi:fatty acid desaturase